MKVIRGTITRGVTARWWVLPNLWYYLLRGPPSTSSG
jgi:hypothetical protein